MGRALRELGRRGQAGGRGRSQEKLQHNWSLMHMPAPFWGPAQPPCGRARLGRRTGGASSPRRPLARPLLFSSCKEQVSAQSGGEGRAGSRCGGARHSALQCAVACMNRPAYVSGAAAPEEAAAVGRPGGHASRRLESLQHCWAAQLRAAAADAPLGAPLDACTHPRSPPPLRRRLRRSLGNRVRLDRTRNS